ncbi:PucR family transcriptional regulator [Microbacterium sp. zg-YB36]|uniref:PucR family transcriptional regulator n=1 Tax=Microbacterium sp. zg-YB36 TaxID=2969407 RepID=UPI00214C8B99|nr:PucR family transcriptional regulator [Microbacterium sp. zg-YB36]MDL5351408.1 PucR family transcriptional regulator [Microbacterium sp. zg-YB36]
MAATADLEPTLGALLGRRELRLRLASDVHDLPGDALDRPIRWVHGSDLADPTPFLADDLVLLTTGTQFAAAGDVDAQPYVDYVRRLSGRAVAGLGFGTEVARTGIPPALERACRDAGMPLFEVPYDTPFIAVARANAETIAAQAYARRSWALAAQRAISLAALRPDGLGATIGELARQLNTWVGMYDAAGELVREHPADALDADAARSVHDEVGAVLRRGARAGSSLRRDGRAFTLQTLGRGGRLRGVVAIAAGDLDREGRDVVTSVISMASLALEQHQRLGRARDVLRTGMLQSLRTGDPGLARRISRDAWGPMPVAPIVVAVTDAAAASDALGELLELRADERRGALFYGQGDDGMVLAVAAAETEILDEVATLFALALGVSAPTGYDGFDAALQQARVARDRGGRGVTHFADASRTGILSALSTHEGRALASALLQPLVAHDAAHATSLVPTLRAWLDADCSHEAAARALGVHRHTVRTRLAAAEAVLGRDLAAFAFRAELWAAFAALG